MKKATNIKEIIVTGAESSGKTTLTVALSRRYDSIWVAEYAREYLTASGGSYERDDIRKIALGQADWQATARAQALSGDYIFVDTDALVCKIWETVKYGDCCAEIEAIWQASQAYFYLLCAPDIAWQPDPLREIPDDAARWRLFEQYKSTLEQANRDFLIVSGSLAQRLAQVADYLDKKAKN
jgi:nicotinamide riboside kinase